MGAAERHLHLVPEPALAPGEEPLAEWERQLLEDESRRAKFWPVFLAPVFPDQP